VITIHQRHRQTDGQTDRRTDGRTSSDPMTATLLKHVAVKMVYIQQPPNQQFKTIVLTSITRAKNTTKTKMEQNLKHRTVVPT